MTSRSILFGALLGALLVTASPAAAQSACEGDSIPCSRQLRSGGQVEEALAMLLRIRQSDDSTLVQGQIGLAYTDLERWPEAHAELSAARERGGPWVDDNGERIAQVLAFVGEHLALLRFEGAPAGAELQIDGQPRGRFPMAQPVGVMPGEIEVSVRADGRAPFTATVSGAAGERVTVEVALAEVDAHPDLPPPTSSPVGGGGVEAGPWVVVGAGAAIAITGAVLLGVGQAEVAAVNNPPGNPSWSEFEARADAALALSNAGAVLLPVGLLVAIGGVVWALLAGESEPPSEAARRATELRF